MSQSVRSGIPSADSAHSAMIELDNVSKTYQQWQRSASLGDIGKNLFRRNVKEIHALKEVTLRVARNEFVAYAGPNGAGKSTTMKILCGMLTPNSGGVRVMGMHPGKQRVPLMARTGVLFGQRTELWWDHPVQMSFEWKKTVWDIPGARYERMLRLVTDMLDLGPLLQTFARELSLGQRMRADIGMLLLHEPELLLLDEPTLGLDLLAKRQLIEFLKHLHREEGTTVVVTSHDMDDLQEMAQRLVLIAGGSIAFDGGFDELQDIAPESMEVEETVERKGVPIEKVITALYRGWAGKSE